MPTGSVTLKACPKLAVCVPTFGAVGMRSDVTVVTVAVAVVPPTLFVAVSVTVKLAALA